CVTVHPYLLSPTVHHTPHSTPFPYTTLFRSLHGLCHRDLRPVDWPTHCQLQHRDDVLSGSVGGSCRFHSHIRRLRLVPQHHDPTSEQQTSNLHSQHHLVPYRPIPNLSSHTDR